MRPLIKQFKSRVIRLPHNYRNLAKHIRSDPGVLHHNSSCFPGLNPPPPPLFHPTASPTLPSHMNSLNPLGLHGAAMAPSASASLSILHTQPPPPGARQLNDQLMSALGNAGVPSEHLPTLANNESSQAVGTNITR